MIQKISPSENKYNLKQNCILASAGGVTWGAIEIYNTKKELINIKKDYKYWLKSATESKDIELKREQLYESILSTARNIDKIDPTQNCEKNKREIINKLKKNRADFFLDNKNLFKQKIKLIKSQAPFIITLKTFVGAAIGLGISFLINYIKDKTKKS